MAEASSSQSRSPFCVRRECCRCCCRCCCCGCATLLLMPQQCCCFLLLFVIVCRMEKKCCWFIESDSSVFCSLEHDVFLVYSLAVLSHLRPRFVYILGNCGHARSQGGRHPAAAKPPLYVILNPKPVGHRYESLLIEHHQYNAHVKRRPGPH